jgi:hypothetical protein
MCASLDRTADALKLAFDDVLSNNLGAIQELLCLFFSLFLLLRSRLCTLFLSL